MLPRDDKKHRAKFPSMEGCRAAAGWSENAGNYCHTAPHPLSCHCEHIVAISFLSLCRSGAYAPCAYPRICSNCASACFHILGFIASIAWQSSNLCRRAATQHLYFEPCTLHFIKTGHTCPVFIQSIRVWWRQYLLCPLHCAITRRRGFQTIYIDVVRGVGRQIFS